jgi:hypothetical protein
MNNFENQRKWREKQAELRKEKWLKTWKHLNKDEKNDIIKMREDWETLEQIAKKYNRSIWWIWNFLKKNRF